VSANVPSRRPPRPREAWRGSSSPRISRTRASDPCSRRAVSPFGWAPRSLPPAASRCSAASPWRPAAPFPAPPPPRPGHRGTTNPAFGARYPDAPKTLYGDADFVSLWSGPGRVVLIVPADAEAEALGRLPAGSYRVLARSGGKAAYVNRAG